MSLSQKQIAAAAEDCKFEYIYQLAHEAGDKAATATKPRAVVFGQAIGLSNEIDPSKPTYYEPEGLCGFAWVAFKGTTAFARWAKKHKRVSKNHPTGLCFWVSDYNQSVARKEAYARAFADVLRAHGIDDAYADSRLD